ncbi:LysR family transcriptional regulator, partial [Hungatella sp.]
MTIRYLEIFVEVCKQMNMSKAAQSLMISQSSVSQAVAALEKEYGTILFERLNHSLYLTKAGEQMLYLSSQVLKSVSQMEKTMKLGNTVPTLNIGVCTTIGSCLLHPLLAAYRKRCGAVHVSAEINNSRVLEEKLLHAQLDLAVIQETDASPYLRYRPFLKDRLAVICWNGHPLAEAGRKTDLTELQKETFVGRESGSGTDYLLKQVFSSHGLSLKLDWCCNSIEGIKQAVIHRAGLAVMSEFLIQKELADKTFRVVEVNDFVFARRFVLACHK